MMSMKNYGQIHLSSNNLVPNVFASYYHLEIKIVRYTFQTFLHWKRSLPQVQFLLLFTFVFIYFFIYYLML